MALLLFAPPVLPLAPTEYNPEYFNQLIRSLNIYLTQIGSTTPIVIDQLTLLALPTSPVGLRPGTVWNDSGTLKIVIANTILVPTATELTITGYLPVLDRVTPLVKNVNLVGVAPILIQNGLITPSGAVTITGLAPTVLKGNVIPSVAVTITGIAPTITVA